MEILAYHFVRQESVLSLLNCINGCLLAFLKCIDGSVLSLQNSIDGSVLAFLKCMAGSVLAFLKCTDGSVWTYLNDTYVPYGTTLGFPLNLLPLDFHSWGILVYHDLYEIKATQSPI